MEVRDVYIDKLNEFAEIGDCDTAAAVTTNYEIIHKDIVIYSKNSEKVGLVSMQLTRVINDIQIGDVNLNNNWVRNIR